MLKNCKRKSISHNDSTNRRKPNISKINRKLALFILILQIYNGFTLMKTKFYYANQKYETQKTYSRCDKFISQFYQIRINFNFSVQRIN